MAVISSPIRFNHVAKKKDPCLGIGSWGILAMPSIDLPTARKHPPAWWWCRG